MIYEQHAKAFTNVSAYVILHDGKPVATVAFKFPKDDAGKLWAYVHFFGLTMVRGCAGGYGYDKRTAACAAAAYKLPNSAPDNFDAPDVYHNFDNAMRADGGLHWYGALTRAGFTVTQVV